jgi:hypothetical protein
MHRYRKGLAAAIVENPPQFDVATALPDERETEASEDINYFIAGKPLKLCHLLCCQVPK